MKKLFSMALGLCSVVYGEDTTVYVGTAAKGVYVMNLDEETGRLSEVKLAAEGKGMSFQELNAEGDLLFSTMKKDKVGGVAAFAVDGGKLTLVSEQTYEGKGLCHVSLDAEAKVLFGADYGGGKVVSFSVAGGELGEIASLIQHEGASVHESRQTKAHAHSIYAGPQNRFVYAPDLGMDEVKFYELGEKGKLIDRGGFASIPGAGPRHMKFGKDGKFAYVLNELSCSVTTFARDAESGKLTAQKTVTTLADEVELKGMTCSEIRVSKNGRFVYAATRDTTMGGRDGVSVFEVGDGGGLTMRQWIPAGVNIPRNINLAPSGDWLLVAGAKSDAVVVFKVDQNSGKLTLTEYRAEVPRPMCVNFSR